MNKQEKKECVYKAMVEVETSARVIGEIIDDAKENDPEFYEEQNGSGADAIACGFSHE